MYVQLFPIYGFTAGVNYWNSNMDTDIDPNAEVEHLVQILIGFVGISFHFWR